VRRLGCQQGTHSISAFDKKMSPILILEKGGNLLTPSLCKTLLSKQILDLKNG
jgi:hypothetical protein